MFKPFVVLPDVNVNSYVQDVVILEEDKESVNSVAWSPEIRYIAR